MINERGIAELEKQLTESERRKLRLIREEAVRKERDFWIEVMKRKGYTNVTIARWSGLSEGTVRGILKKQPSVLKNPK